MSCRELESIGGRQSLTEKDGERKAEIRKAIKSCEELINTEYLTLATKFVIKDEALDVSIQRSIRPF